MIHSDNAATICFSLKSHELVSIHSNGLNNLLSPNYFTRSSLILYQEQILTCLTSRSASASPHRRRQPEPEVNAQSPVQPLHQLQELRLTPAAQDPSLTRMTLPCACTNYITSCPPERAAKQDPAGRRIETE